MLHSLLRLSLNPVDGFTNSAAPVDPTGAIPPTHAVNYDTAVNWAPGNPEKSMRQVPQHRRSLDDVSVELKRRLMHMTGKPGDSCRSA